MDPIANMINQTDMRVQEAENRILDEIRSTASRANQDIISSGERIPEQIRADLNANTGRFIDKISDLSMLVNKYGGEGSRIADETKLGTLLALKTQTLEMERLKNDIIDSADKTAEKIYYKLDNLEKQADKNKSKILLETERTANRMEKQNSKQLTKALFEAERTKHETEKQLDKIKHKIDDKYGRRRHRSRSRSRSRERRHHSRSRSRSRERRHHSRSRSRSRDRCRCRNRSRSRSRSCEKDCEKDCCLVNLKLSEQKSEIKSYVDDKLRNTEEYIKSHEIRKLKDELSRCRKKDRGDDSDF